MKKIIFFFLIVSLFYYSSCKNTDPLSGNTIVRGIIYETDTILRKPLEGVLVHLIEKPTDLVFSYIIDSTYTDTNGNFVFSFDAERAVYTLQASKEKYYGGTYNNQVIYKNRDNKFELTMSPHAWLQLHVKNVNPFDENDLLIAGTSEIWNAAPEYTSGINVDFKVTIPVYGNSNNKFEWSVTKNLDLIVFSEYIYFQGHDTTYYELFY